MERPWGILSLFTTCLPLWVNSSHQSRCHVSPTQELRASTLRRKCSPARKSTTRKRQASYLTEKKKTKKDTKATVKMSRLCKAGLFFLRWITADPVPLRELHRRNICVERPRGILNLFTTCLPLWVKSSRQSRCHVSPTQELRASTLRRQCSPARKSTTRRRQANYLTEKKKKKKDTKATVKMSRLCKAGLFFLRWITADPSPWGNFTPPTKH